MSGGHFGYAGSQINDLLRQVGEDDECGRRFPALGDALLGLGEAIQTIERELDYDLSGDKALRMSDARFEARALLMLHRSIARRNKR